MDKLIHGGTVQLWGGWIVSLPPACHERNEDGSWSAWGEDWTMDVTIIETSGAGFLEDQPAHQQIRGQGWTGTRELLREMDDGRAVFRLATTLRAPNSLMQCWVSYLDEGQSAFSESLIAGIRHADESTKFGKSSFKISSMSSIVAQIRHILRLS